MAAAPGARGTLTAMLRSWGEVGELRGDDVDLKAPAFNLRLAEAGVLEGRPGAWEPTRPAALVGVLEVERTKSDSVVYTSLEYAPLMQELLLQLYRDGSL